jgi:predicted signal transduction protein with EAL and GGDEF domain
MGVHLDRRFRTGYSSLSALQQFRSARQDRSVVRGNAATDLDDATIVRTIIEMGRSLGLQVVAEGTRPTNSASSCGGAVASSVRTAVRRADPLPNSSTS